MDNIILHDATRAQLEQAAQRPSHALLLCGPTGVGKTFVAEALLTRVLGLQPGKLSTHPYLLTIQPDGASISIDSIRQLQKFLSLKTTGKQAYRRAVLLEYAQALTTEAQNAFLKLLEEPPADTIIVLTVDSPRALLPTIMSRVQTITVHPPTKDQLQRLLDASNKSADERKQAYFLSTGLPGLLHALLYDENHPLLASVSQAKSLLQQQPFERLASVDALSKQKENALGLVEALERIAQAGLTGAGHKGDGARVKQWHRVRKAALQAQHALSRSANAKLVLDQLFLQLP